MSYKYVDIEIKNFIAIVKINRPEALNALNMDVLTDLDRVLLEIRATEDTRAVILTGEGKAFVAGADIAAMSEMDIDAARGLSQYGSEILRKWEKLEIPTIAAVNGFALGGGCELAMACDIIIASENAKFGQPEVGLGVPPGFSGTQRLARRIGAGKAKELIFTGDVISADEAFSIGLINNVVAREELLEVAEKLAEQIASKAPIAVRYSKAAIDRGLQTDIDSGIAVENELFAMTFATRDQKEGMRAFLEKRPAVFEGN